MTRNLWIKGLLKKNEEICKNNPNVDPNVLRFITELTTCAALNDEQRIIVHSTFASGYCYYFAHMLKTAFQRGQVCIAVPYGHCVWVDENGIAYDVDGINNGEQLYNIPETYLGSAIQCFTHVPGQEPPELKKEDIIKLIREYEKRNKLPPADLSRYHLE